MADKTKAQLQDEITELRTQIKTQEITEQVDEAVKPVWAMYQAYIKAGFTEEQAWQISLYGCQWRITAKENFILRRNT